MVPVGCQVSVRALLVLVPASALFLAACGSGTIESQFTPTRIISFGDAMSDLSGKRGRIAGTESIGGGRTVVRAVAPQGEMLRYAIDLRSISRGRGKGHRHRSKHLCWRLPMCIPRGHS